MKWTTKAAGVLSTLACVGVLTFGATQVLAEAPSACDTGPEVLGTCPPFTNSSCDSACKAEFGPESGGRCFGECCVCMI